MREIEKLLTLLEKSTVYFRVVEYLPKRTVARVQGSIIDKDEEFTFVCSPDLVDELSTLPLVRVIDHYKELDDV